MSRSCGCGKPSASCIPKVPIVTSSSAGSRSSIVTSGAHSRVASLQCANSAQRRRRLVRSGSAALAKRNQYSLVREKMAGQLSIVQHAWLISHPDARKKGRDSRTAATIAASPPIIRMNEMAIAIISTRSSRRSVSSRAAARLEEASELDGRNCGSALSCSSVGKDWSPNSTTSGAQLALLRWRALITKGDMPRPAR
jgi:hypothetical protein